MPHQWHRSLARNDSFARAAAQVRLGSPGRPTPVRRLPIDLRRAASPHAALRQTQRFPPSRQASTSAERVADGDAETMRKQGANFAVLSSRGWRVPDLAVSCPRKGFQNHWFWRRSFLPFFRRRKKGSHRRRNAGIRIATLQEMQRITGRRGEGSAPSGGQQGGGGAGRCVHRPLRNNNGKRSDKSKTGG